MLPVLRWFRLLVIALLLPAYALAAIGTPPGPGAASAACALADTETPDGDVAALVDELGDTTDDMSDHCLPYTATFPTALTPAAPASLGRRLAVDAPLTRILRPPRQATGC
ncbi:hypothetical protein [Roseateles sp. BYS96W]|uniref:Uncharacterized protein n=1 Tax=Pelomonas nitida TaxID=3299027 RepID=A0ABW7G794_9BURK